MRTVMMTYFVRAILFIFNLLEKFFYWLCENIPRTPRSHACHHDNLSHLPKPAWHSSWSQRCTCTHTAANSSCLERQKTWCSDAFYMRETHRETLRARRGKIYIKLGIATDELLLGTFFFLDHSAVWRRISVDTSNT